MPRPNSRNKKGGKFAATTKATVVFVTHSITEAVFLADRVVLLSARQGRLRSVTPMEFERPRELDVETMPQSASC